MKFLKALGLLSLIFIFSCDRSDPSDGVYADIITERGAIMVKLNYEKTPITVANFVSLAEGTNPRVNDSLKGKHFYDGLPFHRVIEDFMIQGGDIERNGSGNPGYTFEDEFPKDSLGNLLFTHNSKGIMSMANSGPGTNGSQFFITHKETSWLDGKHTIFGKVVEGLNFVDSIQQGDKIISIRILRKGKQAKRFSPEIAIENARREEQERALMISKKRALDSISFSAKMEESKADILSSGLKILYINKGSGKKLKYGDKIKVHYKGYFVDGKVFDTSYKRQKPFEFTLGVDRVIQGWTEGVSLLRAGDEVRLFIPYDLGYGLAGYGPIPAKSKLVFELEVIEIMK